MTIDEAIKNLKQAKAQGTKSVVLAWWSAEDFNKPDDQEWEATAARIEDKMDWSGTHDTMEALVEFDSLSHPTTEPPE
jgi:hypothetical protein